MQENFQKVMVYLVLTKTRFVIPSDSEESHKINEFTYEMLPTSA